MFNLKTSKIPFKYLSSMAGGVLLSSLLYNNPILAGSRFSFSNTRDVRSPKVCTNCMNSQDIISQNTPDFKSLEKSIHQQINQYRGSKNLPPLKLDPHISKQARIHSQNMAGGRVKFSHDGFQERIEIINSFIPNVSAAENVAYNQGYPDPNVQAVKGWLNSPGHHKNIVGKYNVTGIGMAKNARDEYYVTQIFLLSK